MSRQKSGPHQRCWWQTSSHDGLRSERQCCFPETFQSWWRGQAVARTRKDHSKSGLLQAWVRHTMAKPGRPPGWELLGYTHGSSFTGYARDEQQRLSEQSVTGAWGECLSQSSPDGVSISHLREWQDHPPKSKTWLSFALHHNLHLSVSHSELC